MELGSGRRTRIAALCLGLALALVTGCALTESPNRMKTLARRAYESGAGYPTLDSQIFAPRVIYTGVMRAERFARLIGMWVFLDRPHRAGTTPVLLVHGHTTGPRPFGTLAASLDRSRFEPWFTFYATGLEIERSASLLRERLSQLGRIYGTSEVVIVAYSMGGLVSRQALRPYDDGLTLPRVPLLIGIANPWGGSEEGRFQSERSFAPRSWKEIAVRSPFISRLFSDPLPRETRFHMIYGLGGEPDKVIGAQNDGILSKDSLARKEALAEASSVAVLDDATHASIIRDSRTISMIARLLDDYRPR